MFSELSKSQTIGVRQSVS